ncbi:YlbG family protein [Paenibacillus sp. TAB 01]|uniref:YlbG family protein n=1 Tax=Paenibacillus sp. TAB 01 TaxID=3368988 RepID=UPI003752F860
MFTDRSGIIVWVSDSKAAAKHLERYGSVHFISKRMHYAAMYVHSSKLEETMKQLQKLPFVKKVERSYRNEIKTEYSSNMPDKTRFYTL